MVNRSLATTCGSSGTSCTARTIPNGTWLASIRSVPSSMDICVAFFLTSRWTAIDLSRFRDRSRMVATSGSELSTLRARASPWNSSSVGTVIAAKPPSKASGVLLAATDWGPEWSPSRTISWSAAEANRKAMQASSIDSSMCWPPSPRSRAKSAAVMAWQAV